MRILECSTRGDARFSSFYAIVEADGKKDSIENHYQLSKRFGETVPKSWRDSKGRKPTHIEIKGRKLDIRFLTQYYKLLWCKYLDENPYLITIAKKYDDFSDIFKGNSINCQADVIRQYVKIGRHTIIEDCKELLDILEDIENEDKKE